MSLGEYKSDQQVSDEQLIERFRLSHDNVYIGELYSRYAHLILGLAIKYFKNETDATDAVSAIFELLLKELKKYQVENFKSWLYTVSKNYCLQELRKRKSSKEKSLLYEDFVQETMENGQAEHLSKAEKEKVFEQLEKSVNLLKYNQRLCIKMFYLEGLTYADISAQTGFSLKEIKSYIQNGKRNLQILMTQENNGKQ
jgi:RNA polymerase sigma factor (sigma-70 family)